MSADTEREKADKRHITGFKRFQNAAIRALSAALGTLKNTAEEGDGRARPAVKLSDMKSLVTAYRDAVVGERMVLGLDGRHDGRPSGDWPDEMVIRWVEDIPKEPDDEEHDA